MDGEVAERLKAAASKAVEVIFASVSSNLTLSARKIDFIKIKERCPSWLKEHDWKSCVLSQAAPRVRIPLSPPYISLLQSTHPVGRFSCMRQAQDCRIDRGQTSGPFIDIRMFGRRLSASDPGKLFHVVPCFS
jgi:hypothetical protein